MQKLVNDVIDIFTSEDMEMYVTGYCYSEIVSCLNKVNNNNN